MIQIFWVFLLFCSTYVYTNITIMISIEQCIYKYIFNYSIQVDCCSGTNGFINFWVRFFDTRREREIYNSLKYFIIILCKPHSQRFTHLVVFKISIHLTVEIRKTQLFDSMAESPTTRLHGPISTVNWLFFKILKFSGLSLPGMRWSTLLSHFLSVFLGRWWLTYPLCASVKLCPMTMHLNS